MKLRINIIILFTLIAITSCNTRQPILKKWKLDHIDASELIADIPKEMKDTLQMLINEESDFQKGKMTFDFKENGKIEINSANLQGNWEKLNGTWILNEESKLLIVQMKDKKDEYILHKLTETDLIIELIDKRAELSISGMSKGTRQGTKVKSVFK